MGKNNFCLLHKLQCDSKITKYFYDYNFCGERTFKYLTVSQPLGSQVSGEMEGRYKFVFTITASHSTDSFSSFSFQYVRVDFYIIQNYKVLKMDNYLMCIKLI